MNISDAKLHVSTPAFVLDKDQVFSNLTTLEQLRTGSGCKVLYSMKALPMASVLEWFKDRVDGISVSSLFEARLARSVIGGAGSLHLTTPGLRVDEFPELADLCTHISFNSLSQYETLYSVAQNYSPGFRVNPQLSFVDDARYDPCRKHSKLGVDVDALRCSHAIKQVEGLHFHTVFGFRHCQPLLKTLTSLSDILDSNRQLCWLNLGGGYLYHDMTDRDSLIDAIVALRSKYELEIFIEPGKGLVGNAGYLITTVLDRLVSGGKTVLVLDTSVNHLPEVFEYQLKPTLLEENGQGNCKAILAGSTCLAGDLFGEFAFSQMPAVGDRLVFADVGAYSLIKASRFNGYNLPTIYFSDDERIELAKTYQYADYHQQWSV